jgi:similar to stage IV sporulation protein
MNRIIWVSINSSKYYKLLFKINEIGISIYDILKKDNSVLLKINYSDYKRLKKYLVSYKVTIYSDTGIYKFIYYLKKYIVFIIASFISIIILLLANNIVYKVDIKTSDKKIKEILLKEIDNYSIGVMHFKKRHKDIEVIVDKILDNNKDSIEWLEIKYDGLIMNVLVTPKSKVKDNSNYKYCNIIAKTDARINAINVKRGSSLKEINDYVIKGDIIISGLITNDTDIKNIVCADGDVYGETWYRIKVSIPLLEEKINYTGKNRYNIEIVNKRNRYLLLKSRIKNGQKERINIYKLNDFEINIVKEKEINKIAIKLSEKDAENKAINEGINKLKMKLDKNGEIIYQNVLKKELNNSTMYIEIFVVTKEQIGVTQILEEDDIYDIGTLDKVRR